MHTAILLGPALALAEVARRDGLPGRVRLVFQPAEEVMPGGALDVIEAGLLDPADLALALHCDPTLEVGQIGLRTGPITAASDMITVHADAGPAGTPRVRTTPSTWSTRSAGCSPSCRPRSPGSSIRAPRSRWSGGRSRPARPPTRSRRPAIARGTVRVLDRDTWATVPEVLARLAEQIVAPYGAEVEIEHQRGVPPVVNDAAAVGAAERGGRRRARRRTRPSATAQSLGGEDFGWYLEHVPGAMARLGVRAARSGTRTTCTSPASTSTSAASAVGVRLLTAAALLGAAGLAVSPTGCCRCTARPRSSAT